MAKINTVFSLTDNVSNQLNKITKNVFNTTKGFDSMAGKLISVNSALDLVGKGLSLVKSASSFLGKFISDASEYESLLVRLTVATGDAVMAQEEFQKLKDFAKTSPFDLPGVVQASIMFRNAGIEAENLIPTIKMLGDVAQGNNEYFNRMALNFMQIKSAGKATMQDLNQFAYMGVPIKQVLKDIGVTGTATFEDIQKAFILMTSEGGQFYNSMSSNAGTVSGQLSNMNDAMQQFSATIGNKMLPSIRNLTQRFGDFISNVQKLESFNKLLDNFEKRVKDFEKHIGGLIATIVNLGTVATTVGAVMAGAWVVANWPLVLGIALIVNFIRLFNDLINSVNDASLAMNGFENQCTSALGTFGVVIGFITGTIAELMNIIYNVMATVYNALVYISEFVLNLFTNPIKAVGRLFLDLANTILQVLSTVAGALDLVFNTNMSEALNNASKKLEAFKEDKLGDVHFKYAKAQLKDVEGVLGVANSAKNFGADIGRLIDGNLIGLPVEEIKELNDKLKTDGSGALVVSDKNTVNLADDFRELLSEQATKRFNLQFSQVTPSVNVGDIVVNNNADYDRIIDSIVSGAEEAQSSSLRS